MLALIYLLVKAIRASQALAAQWAFLCLIAMECPCCDEPIILPAKSKQMHDEETS
jgi:hypothetical protein